METVPVVEVSGAQATGHPITVVRDREAALSLRLAGTIVEMPVRIGDRLPRGALVARIDATPFREARVRAEAEVARLARAAARNRELLPAGAISQATHDDTLSALSAARAALADARYDERSAVARMPFAGVVLAREAELGETVAAGQALARVADTGGPVLARAAVPAAEAMRLRRGGAATVEVGGARFAAAVRRVGAASDPRTATVEVDLALQGVSGLASGLVGTAVLGRAVDAPSAQLIPAEALLDARNGVGHVFVLDRARSVARRTRVALLGFDGDRLSVQGLPTGSRVITSGAGFVADGQRVASQGR